MKKPSFDFSKQGINRFLLHHVEKIILVVGLVCLGVFFWLGFSSEKFDKQSPKGLVQHAERAHSHIVSNTSWEKIQEFRNADDDAHIRIAEADNMRIPTDAYPYSYVSGTPAMTAGLRKDPEIIPAQFLMAESFPATVLIKLKDLNMGSNKLLDKLEPAGDEDLGSDDLTGGGGFPGGPPGGMGGAGDRRGRAGRPSTSRRKPRDDGTVKPGDYVPEYQEQETYGIRPQFAGASSSNSRAFLCNVTAVTGIVRYENQASKFNNVFAGARGYYPDRDRPIYQYLQIQRRIEDGEWEDVTTRITDTMPRLRYIADAPEVIAPDFYDEVLTTPIPTMTQVDYRLYSGWPLKGHDVPEKLNAAEGFTGIPLRNVLAYDDDSEDSSSDDEQSSVFGDPFSQPKAGDNNLANRDRPNRGGNRRRQGGIERGGGSKPPAEMRSARLGSDRSKYDEAIASLKALEPYKLIRFFDVEPIKKNAKPHKVQYRVRLWLADPNNENPDGLEGAEKARKKDRGSKIGMGGGAGLSDDGPAPGDRGGGGGRGGKKKEPVEKAVYVKVGDTMKHPSVRTRIDSQQLELPKDRKDLKYTIVSEWSEPTEWIVVGGTNPAEFFAGRVIPPKATKIRDNYVELGEPVANVVAAKWDPAYGIRIPANREARRSDVLSFHSDAHILHPLDGSVRKIPNANIETGATVVDIMGGSEIRDLSSSRSTLEYFMPSEILIMTSDGKFIVKNDIADRQNYNHALFLEDETAEIGTRKKKADDKSDRGRGDGPGT